jgi:signal transduction histidine kinase
MQRFQLTVTFFRFRWPFRKLFFCSFILLQTMSAIHCYGQVLGIQQYSRRHFTDEDGLPQNSVKSIMQDENGFIWLSTEDGLERFDGSKFVRFGKENMAVSSNRFQVMYPGKGGKGLFTITERHQQVRIEKGRAFADSISPMPFRVWQKNHPGDTWDNNVSYSTGLPQKHRQHSIRKNIIPVEDGDFACTPDSIIFFNTAHQPAWQIGFRPGNLWDFFPVDNHLYFLHPDLSISALTVSGEKRFFPEGDILTDPLFHLHKQPVTIFWNGCVSNHVLFYFNHCFYVAKRNAGGQLYTKRILRDFDIEENKLGAAFYNEKDGRLYLGSETKGLFVFSPQFFKTLTAAGEENVYYAQAEYAGNSLLTPQGNLFSFSDSFRTIGLLKQLTPPDLYSLLIDKKGDIWTKGGSRLYKLDQLTFRLLGQWKLPGEISVLYQDSNEKLWISTVNGLYTLDTNVPDAVPMTYSPVLHNISCIQEDSSGFLWMGAGDGLYRVRIANKIIDTIPGLRGDYVRSIYMQNNENIWITTYEKGFFLYRNNKLTRFPLDNENYLSASHCITEDNKGFFWITTNKGLFQVSGADLLNFAEGKQEQLFYLYYDKSNGFNTNEFNGGCEPCAVKMKNGHLSFPSLNGLVVFNPDSIRAELPNGELFIDEIELDHQKINPGKTIRLPRQFGQLKFHVSTPYMGSRYNINIFYALFDRSRKEALWLRVPPDGSISFSALRPGKYTLVIRKINGFGKDNFTEKKIVLVVPFAWYQTIWFYGGCLLLLFLFVLLFIRLRLRYIRKKNRLLEQLVTEKTGELVKQNDIQEKIIRSISHDIRTPLRYQHILSQEIYEVLQKENNKTFAAPVKVLSDYTHRLYHMVENLVEYLKAQMSRKEQRQMAFDLKELIDEKIEIFREIAREKETALNNNTAPGLLINTNQQLLSIILHNLLDNAVKVTRNGTIQFDAVVSGNQISITVSDTGPGINKEISKWINEPGSKDQSNSITGLNGMGLVMVKEMAEMAGITVKVSSQPGEGTSFLLIMIRD